MKQSKSLSPGSLNRASLILRAIAQGSRKGSLITEIVARTSIPRPTVHRILEMLIELDWVKRDPQTSRYNFAQELAALGYSAITRNPIERLATTQLDKLANKLGQVVYLNIRSGWDSVCVGRYESQSQIQIGKGFVGMRTPLGLTPSCMAILAKLPKNEIEEVISHNLSRFYRIDGFEELGFRKSLQQAVENDYTTYDGIVLDRSTGGLGVAICDPTGYPIAGIGTTYIIGWLSKTQLENCRIEMSRTAKEIGQLLIAQRQPKGEAPMYAVTAKA
jgi:DNA-binding IclR family transcriptional regulator